MMRPGAAVPAATFLALVALALVPVAAAHAEYVRSEPAKGAHLETVPAEVVLWLSERVDPSASWLRVFDAAGARVDDGDLAVENAERGARLAVGVDIGPGAYLVEWDTISTVDGHANPGIFSFAVGDAEVLSVPERTAPLEPVPATARALSYAGFALAFGAVAFLSYVLPQSGTARGVTAMRALLPLGALLQGAGVLWLLADTSGRTELGALAFLRSGEVGRLFALRLLVAALALALALRVFLRRDAGQRSVAAVLAALIIAAWLSARLGHASSAGAWAIALDLLHLIGAAVWIGGLACLLVFLAVVGRKADPSVVRRVGLAFSGVALAAVTLLAATGVATGLVILGTDILLDPARLYGSPYGLFLLGKIGVALLMVGLAALNRYLFLARFPTDGAHLTAAGDARPSLRSRTPRVSTFRSTVALEASFGTSVLFLAGFLTALSPPLDLDVTDTSEIFRVSGEGGDFRVVLRVEPAAQAPGESRIHLHITDKTTGEPLPEAIRVVLESAHEGGEEGPAQRFEAAQTGPGEWIIERIVFVGPGDHTFTVSIDTPYVYRDTVTFVVPVAARDA